MAVVVSPVSPFPKQPALSVGKHRSFFVFFGIFVGAKMAAGNLKNTSFFGVNFITLWWSEEKMKELLTLNGNVSKNMNQKRYTSASTRANLRYLKFSHHCHLYRELMSQEFFHNKFSSTCFGKPSCIPCMGCQRFSSEGLTWESEGFKLGSP